MTKKVTVIGSGFAGLSAAACLARKGFSVTVLEKNSSPGGRARKFMAQGFSFDMGPSWYWMPDVFDRFFALFGKRTSDYYQLERLDPSYRVYYGPGDYLDVPASLPAIRDLFEKLEPGSGASLEKFLEDAAFKYKAGMGTFVYKPTLSFQDLISPSLLRSAFRLDLLKSHASYVRRFFKNPRLVGLLEFPVLFLGAGADKIPAMYSLMNYADLALGTWYPQGGIYRVIEAMTELAIEQGVTFKFDTAATSIAVTGNQARGVWSDGRFFRSDYIVAAADYHHTEHQLLESEDRSYSPAYWDTRTMAPSCLLYFVGVNKRINGLQHHNLFFDEDITPHLRDIYDEPRWPDAPQFYVCCPSKTDATVAPPGSENIFILIPVATGLEDTESVRDRYFSLVIDRMEKILGEPMRDNIIFRKSYAHADFTKDYNAFQGNAYGLANTLMQTANFKPAMRSRKVRNLLYAGQLTVPGPGVPPAIISGEVAANTLASMEQPMSPSSRIHRPSTKIKS